jgi:4-hydroxythreonine-4-phosphate dehydrogenase
MLRRAARLLGSQLEIVEIARPDEARPTQAVIPCLRTGSDDVLAVPPCTIDARSGQAAYDALVVAARLALAGQIDGLVTAPLHKAALWQAGHHYPGHTELLAELCGVHDFAMMLYLAHDEVLTHDTLPAHDKASAHAEAPRSGAANDTAPRVCGPAGLGVVHVTLHMALRDVWTHLTSAAVFEKIRLADQVLGVLKHARPRIGVAALNPHGGESGLFGDEETRIIAPAVAEAVAAGYEAVGPLPTDTLMVRAAAGEFDAVVAMYHDQGHIALKLLGMHRAVNVTLGLPIVRTSVAHGTAFDLAWQGRAETSSMLEAVRVAAELASSSLRQETESL